LEAPVKPNADVIIVGGGIVGMATAAAIVGARRGSVLVLEAEPRLAAHQTGHNSGVIHAGLYYKPGSVKARTCRAGLDAMYRFCDEEGIPHRRSGKLVVAVAAEELGRLAVLEERGQANGVQGIRRLSHPELAEFEPQVVGVAGLWVPETGVVDYAEVTAALARRVTAAGGQVETSVRLLAVRSDGDQLVLETTAGVRRGRVMVNCAGLQSDRIARISGVEPGVRIVPFRGEYYELKPDRRELVRGLIYPVPDPALPFLGVHFTRRISDRVEAGPNAVLAFRREGYARSDFSLRDMAEALVYPGFWRMAAAQWRNGLDEFRRSMSRRLFARALQRLVPAVQEDDLQRAGSGVRAQAVGMDGRLVDDFHVVESPRMVHVLNAPSPAATASLAIGQELATRILQQPALA
jgi:L-2-hydroxyglutarate oxidase